MSNVSGTLSFVDVVRQTSLQEQILLTHNKISERKRTKFSNWLWWF